jgi:hypothetical protein
MSRKLADLQVSLIRGKGINVDVPLLGKSPVEVVKANDTLIGCIEFDTETTIATTKEVGSHILFSRQGYVYMDAAPTSALWRGLVLWYRGDGGQNATGYLALKVMHVTGGAANADLTATGLAVEDKILSVIMQVTAASISTLEDVTHQCTHVTADILNCTANTTSNGLVVFYHDASAAGYEVSNIRMALLAGTTADTDIACVDAKTSAAIAVADAIIYCGHISTVANTATWADLTSECHCTHTAGSIQMETTDTSNDGLLVIWQDVA